MLALTTEAQEAIEALLAASSVSPDGGLRISPPPDPTASADQLQVTLASLPAEDDQVIDEHGARVFVDEAAADYLDDKLLDARIYEGQVSFALAEQG
jgi:Fe-S cluster assembly iron-binding protein IscA